MIYLDYHLGSLFSHFEQIHLPPHPSFPRLESSTLVMAPALAFELEAGGQKETSKSLKRDTVILIDHQRETGFMVKIPWDSKITTGGPTANLCHSLSIVTKNLLSSSKLLKKIYSTVIECDIISTFPHLLFIFVY